MAKKKSKDKYKKTKNNSSKQEEDNIFIMLKKAVTSEQFPLAIGIIFFLVAIFMFVSFVSFYVSYATKYEAFESIDASSLLGNDPTHNWLGRLGAWTSYKIIYSTFGLGSFGFVLLLVLLALRILKVKIKQFSKWIVSTVVFMLWISCVMGFVVVCCNQTDLDCLAGLVGAGINQVSMKYIRVFGCAICLLAFTILIPTILFGVKYLWVKQAVNYIGEIKKQEKDSDEDNQLKEDNIIEIEDLKQTVEISNNENNKPKKESNKQDLEPVKQTIATHKPTIETDISKLTAEELPEEFLPHIKKNEQKQDTTNGILENSQQNDKETYNQTEQVNKKHIEDNLSTEDIPFTIKNTSEATDEPESLDNQIESSQNEAIHYTTKKAYDPKADLSYFKFPSSELLINYDKNNKIVTENELIANKQRIIKTLRNYNIEIASIEASAGPTVTLYEIKPAPGIRIAKIKNLEDDIALSLSALGIRIIAPIPGKGTIGIEVPNSQPQVVSMKSMIESTQFQENKYELPIAIGKKIDNTPYVTDLAKMPHLLMAGATGQGKSVGLNAIISSLLYKKHPSELKFIFVDPNKVELSLYSKLDKHYLAKIPDGKEAVITDVSCVVSTLKSLCVLMDNRYELLKAAQCKKIIEYNKKFCAGRLNPYDGHKYMPYIVLVIDEFADLMMTAGKEIEKPICRLAQLARAVGIHLIIATQRPSVNIITGTIKANFPARAAFKVSSLTDSRTILDQKGAEQLIGRGDMLISNGGQLIRLQCALIDTDEIERIANFIGDQQGYADCYLLPDTPEEGDADENSSKKEIDSKLDTLFEEAARMVVLTQQGSTSMLQRKLSLGYNRAGRVMDQLEAAHIVGAFQGSKARNVLISSEEELEAVLAEILNKNL